MGVQVTGHGLLPTRWTLFIWSLKTSECCSNGRIEAAIPGSLVDPTLHHLWCFVKWGRPLPSPPNGRCSSAWPSDLNTQMPFQPALLWRRYSFWYIHCLKAPDFSLLPKIVMFRRKITYSSYFLNIVLNVSFLLVFSGQNKRTLPETGKDEYGEKDYGSASAGGM